MLAAGLWPDPILPVGGKSIPSQEEHGLKVEGERLCFKAGCTADGRLGGCNSGGSGGEAKGEGM